MNTPTMSTRQPTTVRGRVALMAVFLGVFGSLPVLACMMGPAPLAVTITAAELLGAVLAIWAREIWEGKL